MKTDFLWFSHTGKQELFRNSGRLSVPTNREAITSRKRVNKTGIPASALSVMRGTFVTISVTVVF
jgi:hypothetical protein